MTRELLGMLSAVALVLAVAVGLTPAYPIPACGLIVVVGWGLS